MKFRHHKTNPDRKPTVQQSVSVVRMTMRFGDYALRPTFADEKGGRAGEKNGEMEGKKEEPDVIG